MPELFGSAYVLPAIIVIVLLLVLLVAVMMNKQAQARKTASAESGRSQPANVREAAGRAGHLSVKRRADTKRVAPPVPVGAETPSGAGVVPPLETAEIDASATAPAAHRPESRKGLRPLGQHAAQWEAVRPTPDAVSTVDPIAPVLAELLRGWGDLSREDRNRLSVFRPERLQAALQALPVPKELRNDADARLRLDQLTRYADDLAAARVPLHPLDDEDEPGDEDEVASTAMAPLPASAAALAAAVAQTRQDTVLVPPPGADMPEETLAASMPEDEITAVTPPASSASPEDAESTPSQRHWFFGQDMDDTQERLHPQAPTSLLPDEPGSADESSRDDEALGFLMSHANTGAKNGFGAQRSEGDDIAARVGWQATESTAAMDSYSQLPVSATSDAGEPGPGIELTAEAKDAVPFDLAFGQWEEAAPPTLEEVATFGDWTVASDVAADDDTAAPGDTPAPSDRFDDTVETFPRPRPLLGGMVKTADDLLSLPPDERLEMVAFLQPGELGAVLKRADDPELKKAVIDTLEHVSTPASLEVLRQSLDDSDPQIQMYALQAADRILGAD